MRWRFICDGAVIKYPDGREVCQPTVDGMLEYKRRIQAMSERQGGICCICKNPVLLLKSWDQTFEHANGRGFNAAWRDDRIEDDNGNPMNGAAHYDCNMKKGSKRAPQSQD